MTYLINEENTGLDSAEKVAVMAKMMRHDGFDVEQTKNYGLVNPTESCPCTDKQWENYLILSDE
jgi:hypothetical protein